MDDIDKTIKEWQKALIKYGYAYKTSMNYGCMIRAYLKGKDTYIERSQYPSVTERFERWRKDGVIPSIESIINQNHTINIKPKEKLVIQDLPKKKKRILDHVWGMEAQYIDSHGAVWRGKWENQAKH